DDVGLNSATQYFYVVTAVKDGVQSLASNEASAITSAAAGEPTRINAGGGEHVAQSGAVYRADAFFTGGQTHQISQTIQGTAEQNLYPNERWGNWTYAIPVANGRYDVRLHFAELYYGVGSVPG